MASNPSPSALASDHSHPARRAFCSIIPPDLLHHIANSEHVSDRCRMIAQKSLSRAHAAHQERASFLAPDSDTSAGQGAAAHQSIIPPDVYQGILDSDDTSPEAKA